MKMIVSMIWRDYLLFVQFTYRTLNLFLLIRYNRFWTGACCLNESRYDLTKSLLCLQRHDKYAQRNYAAVIIQSSKEANTILLGIAFDDVVSQVNYNAICKFFTRLNHSLSKQSQYFRVAIYDRKRVCK